ncbi:MAG TPA: hypothetical protein VNE82_05720 [Candidatus Binataceae bacterium]|nr:hypothetical protein [Candidatus Binataceae bacterium]
MQRNRTRVHALGSGLCAAALALGAFTANRASYAAGDAAHGALVFRV